MRTLGLSLILLFLLFFIALSVELLYLILYRRRHRSTDVAHDDPHHRKKLPIFLLCLDKHRSRIEPSSTSTTTAVSALATARVAVEESWVDDNAEMARLQQLYASRALFTIREEEKEGTESEGGRSPRSGRKEVGSLRSCVVIVHEVEEQEEEFVTPCASPVYLTPASSPAHPSVLLHLN